jgi:hypothetical protein
MRTWRHLVELLTEASTPDLQWGDWRFPLPDRSWSVAVQRAGQQAAGAAYRHLEYDLRAFERCDPGSQERLPNGDLRYAKRFELDGHFIVFSGTTARELVRYRLDPNHRRPPLASPFEDLRFEHPGTRWYNIASMRGAAKYFHGGAPSILDLFAEKVARNIREGKRTLLIARKKFRRRCAEYLPGRLQELGVGRVSVVTGGWGKVDLTDPRTLPLINYGISGVNLFEDFDAAYCLSSYYIPAATVAEVLYDIDPTADRFLLEIRRSTGWPPQRRAHVALPDNRETILPRVAQCLLDQMEAGVVVQAVGRVRPFTRPREVITFQEGSFPGVQYVHHFDSFDQARAYFGIQTRRQADYEVRAAQAQRLKAAGLSNRRIAQELGVSLPTIKRYLRRGRGHEML